MKITKRLLKKLIKESIYGSGIYTPGPFNPAVKVFTGMNPDGTGITTSGRLPAEKQRKIDKLYKDNPEMADAIVPLVQNPDLVIPFEGDPYEENVFKGDSYDDEVRNYVKNNNGILINTVVSAINKYIPNLQSFLDKKVGINITTQSKIDLEPYFITIDSKKYSGEDLYLLLAEAIFGEESRAYRAMKVLHKRQDLYQWVSIGYTQTDLGIGKNENNAIFNSARWSIVAYFVLQAVYKGCQLNISAKRIEANYENVGSSVEEIEASQVVSFYSSNELGPAIIRLATIFKNITIDNERISRNVEIRGKPGTHHKTKLRKERNY